MPQCSKYFLTKSRFNGEYSCDLNKMHGFGRYFFPDGSVYRGYFNRGRFHGFGSLLVKYPQPMYYKGFFEDGKLKQLEHMEFMDGLMVRGDFTSSGEMDFGRWKYCSRRNRCYLGEMLYGPEGVGPCNPITASGEERKLHPKDYDAGEGVYVANSGWLGRRPPPLKSHRFVGCEQEKAWIVRHCRRGRGDERQVNKVYNFPDRHNREVIIDTNLKAAAKDVKLGMCPCDTDPLPKHYFPGLCEVLQDRTVSSELTQLGYGGYGGMSRGRSPPPDAVDDGSARIEVSDSGPSSPDSLSVTDLVVQLMEPRPSADTSVHLRDSITSASSSKYAMPLTMPSMLSMHVREVVSWMK